MKKIFLMLIAAAVGTLSGFAQSDLVATLSHGSNLSTYYGADALSEAYTAAAEGDVITLSPGTFNAVNIEKAITVRGAGMQPMEGNGYVPTQIVGVFTVTVPSSSSILTLEGIQCFETVNMSGNNLASVNISKSRFYGLGGDGINLNAHSCVFENLTSNCYNGNTVLNCLNCVVKNPYSQGIYNQKFAKIVSTNCLVLDFTANSGHVLESCIFKNCVIYDGYDLSGTNSAQNCIGISYDGGDIFKNLVNASNVMVEGTSETAYATVFKTLRVNDLDIKFPSPNETFELTPTAAATYLGDDGKQVGIYGGTNPFDPTPSNPQIKKFTVDSSVNSGKLSVKINVE